MKYMFNKGLINAVVLCALGIGLAACSAPKEEIKTDNTIDFPARSVLNFEKIKNIDKLNQDMKEGKIPKTCDVLYDQMGSRPNVILKKPETIKTIYKELAYVIVEGQSQMSMTDCYHHVIFTLQDDTKVGFYFEGTQILTLGQDNYTVSGGTELWGHIKQLQETSD